MGAGEMNYGVGRLLTFSSADNPSAWNFPDPPATISHSSHTPLGLLSNLAAGNDAPAVET